ncbi:MAG: hypothetical protein SGI77_09670 [Pirellulaceae bacterium]|nr:hypothetical protein [Pirellulaceae bacterium]
MSKPSPSVEQKNIAPLMTTIIVIVAAIAIVSGGFKMFSGVQKIASSSSDPKVDLLLKDSDVALDEANKQNQIVVPAFQQLLNDFDQLGVESFRKEKREVSDNLVAQFAKTTGQFQMAAKKLDAAAILSVDKKLNAFIVIKSKSYGLLGNVCDQNAEIIRVLLDDSLVDSAAITEKVLKLAASRDATQKAANDATTEADVIMKGT